MLLTFDDGYICQYEYGLDMLDKHGIKSVFFVSADKSGETDKNYISHEQLKTICEKGHTIGDHTSSHYRFTSQDTPEKLVYEIIDSKNKLKGITGQEIESFCYVGGEMPVYTDESFRMIKENYDYCFTTLTEVTTNRTDKHLIHRTNIESYWNMSLVKLQLCGIWDRLYADKARTIENKLLNPEKL